MLSASLATNTNLLLGSIAAESGLAPAGNGEPAIFVNAPVFESRDILWFGCCSKCALCCGSNAAAWEAVAMGKRKLSRIIVAERLPDLDRGSGANEGL